MTKYTLPYKPVKSNHN